MSDQAFGGDANPVPGNPWSEIVEVHFGAAPLVVATIEGSNPLPVVVDGDGFGSTADPPLSLGSAVDPALYADAGYFDPFGNAGLFHVGLDLAGLTIAYVEFSYPPIPRFTNDYVNRVRRSVIFNMKNITQGGVFINARLPSTDMYSNVDLLNGHDPNFLITFEWSPIIDNVDLKAYPQSASFIIGVDSTLTTGSTPIWTASASATPTDTPITVVFDKNGLVA